MGSASSFGEGVVSASTPKLKPMGVNYYNYIPPPLGDDEPIYRPKMTSPLAPLVNFEDYQQDQFIYEPSDLQTPSHGLLMKHQHLKMRADHDLEFPLKESSSRLETQTRPLGVEIDLQEVDPQLQGSSKIKIPLQKPCDLQEPPLSRQEPRRQGPAPQQEACDFQEPTLSRQEPRSQESAPQQEARDFQEPTLSRQEPRSQGSTSRKKQVNM